MLMRKLKKETAIIGASLLIGLLVTLLVTTYFYSERVSGRIAEKFIRLHVVANSDSDYDQQLKLKVRDGVLEALEQEVSRCASIEEARGLIENSLGRIEREAERIIRSEGRDYTVKAALDKSAFPTKRYGDIALVAGEYEALRIEIGAAAGKNWWCVVYPPLCYVDVAQGATPKSVKSGLQEELGEDYKFLAADEEVSVKVRFKVVELWQEHKAPSLAASEKELAYH